jgi:hypothetical protein
MAKAILATATGKIRLMAKDTSSTTGAGLAGLAHDTAGLQVTVIPDNTGTATTYTSAGSTIEDISSVGTYAAPTSGKVRLKAVDGTNAPGLIELHLATALFVGGSVYVRVHGATNLADNCEAEIQLADVGATATLRAAGLDNISITAPSGVATNFREMLVQVWRWFFKKSTLDATNLKTYADDGSTVVTTQTVSNSGGTQTRGAAS